MYKTTYPAISIHQRMLIRLLAIGLLVARSNPAFAAFALVDTTLHQRRGGKNREKSCLWLAV
jgi:hypothetical protein